VYKHGDSRHLQLFSSFSLRELRCRSGIGLAAYYPRQQEGNNKVNWLVWCICVCVCKCCIQINHTFCNVLTWQSKLTDILFYCSLLKLSIYFYNLTDSRGQSPSWEAHSLQLIKRFPVLFGSWWFITVFTRAHHWSLSGSTWIPSTPHILYMYSPS